MSLSAKDWHSLADKKDMIKGERKMAKAKRAKLIHRDSAGNVEASVKLFSVMSRKADMSDEYRDFWVRSTDNEARAHEIAAEIKAASPEHIVEVIRGEAA